jgi:MFS transporter, NNP family, nitrate/nitrite transporter
MSAYSAIRGKGLAFLLLLWSLWFLIMLLRTILGPMLPMIEDEFTISHAKATTLVSLLALGSAASLLASGILAGKLGYKRTILVCLGVSVVVFLLIPHVRAFSQLGALLFVLGLVTGAYFPCVIPVVTGHFAPSIWGRALAIQDTGASLSVFGAPLLTILLLRFVSWRQFYYFFAVAYLVSGLLFLFFANEVKVDEKLKSYLGTTLRNKSVWILAIIWTFALGAFMGVYQVTPLYFTKELSFSPQYANTIFGLSRLGGVIFGVIMGFVADRFNLKKAMFAVLCITGVFTMLIGQTNLAVVQVALFFQGTAIMGFFSIGLVAISRMFKMEERGVAAGLVASMSGVFGSGLLPYLFGLAGDYLSFRIGILTFGALVVLSSGLVYFLKLPGRLDRQVL